MEEVIIDGALSGKACESLDGMIEYAMLFDFYGALLKNKNAKIFEDYMFNDMSLSEIASEHSMTRQGVRDTVQRAKIKLVDYENKLGLVNRFNLVKDSMNNVRKRTDHVKDIVEGSEADINGSLVHELSDYFDMIEDITDTILEEM